MTDPRFNKNLSSIISDAENTHETSSLMPAELESPSQLDETTIGMISHREFVAELESRINESILVVRGLIRILRHAQELRILIKPTVLPETNSYVDGDGMHKTKTRARKKKNKKKDAETNVEQKTKTKVDPEINIKQTPLTRAVSKKNEELDSNIEQKPRMRMVKKKEEAEISIEQKPRTRTTAKKEEPEINIEQSPMTKAVGKKKELVDTNNEQKTRTRVGKKKMVVDVESEVTAPRPTARVQKQKAKSGVAALSKSANRLYPKNNDVRFKYERKNSRYNQACTVTSSEKEQEQEPIDLNHWHHR